MGIVSRLKLDHPSLGTVGGASLHAAIEALFVKLGDMTNSRYFIADNLNDAASTDLEHNFKCAFDELKVVLYSHDEGTGELTRIVSGGTPDLADFTIIATPSFETTKVRITNGTGSQQDIAAVIVQGDFAESLGELDDVNLSSPPTDKQALLFNTATSKFIPASVLTPSGVEVVTAKDIDGGTASNTSRLTLPKAATATLTALTRKEATIVFDTDTKKPYLDDGAALKVIGGGLITEVKTTDFTATAGKHYLVDFSGAANTDITVTMPAGAAESVVRFSTNNGNPAGTGRLLFTPASGEKFQADGTLGAANEQAKMLGSNCYCQMAWDTGLNSAAGAWLIDDPSVFLTATFSGAITFKGAITASGGFGAAGFATVAAGGIVKLPHKITASRSSNLNLTTATAIAFNAITSGYTLSSSGIVVPESGDYLVSFNTAHNFGTTTGACYLRVVVNSTAANPYIASLVMAVNHGSTPEQYSYHSSGLLTLAVNDVVYLVPVFGGTLNVTAVGTALQLIQVR